MTAVDVPQERVLFDQALVKFDSVVQQVPDDAWGNASPCEEWNAANIVGHVAATTQLPVLLAQRIPLGVPAGPEASEVPTRGDDDLFKGRSSFEIEMIELKSILDLTYMKTIKKAYLKMKKN